MYYVIIYILLHLLHFSATQNVNLSITNNILTCFYSETNMTQIDIFMYNKSIKLNEDTQHVHPDMTYLARYDERNSAFYINHLYAQLGELNINFNYFKIKLNKIEHGDRYQCVVIINFRKVLVSNLVNLKKNMNNYTDIYNVHTNLIHPTQTNKEDFLNYNLSFPIEVDSSAEYELINENSIEIKGSARYESNITSSHSDHHTTLCCCTPIFNQPSTVYWAGSVFGMSVCLSVSLSVHNHYSPHPPPYIELSFSSSICWSTYSPQTSQIQAVEEGSTGQCVAVIP